MSDSAESSLAVVGMAGRTAGADDLDRFWADRVAGVDPIQREPAGPDGRTRGFGGIPGADLFDAEFFGYSPREALMLDPQHRVFLECSWEALENAGYDPSTHPGAIGVFGGSGDTDHALALREHRDRFPGSTPWEFRLASGADFLTSRVAYQFDLRGPAVTVLTACSTSLVAVHMAGQALLAGDCDVALAGGVTVHVPLPAPGEGDEDILSPDARCRPFDAGANGTVPADGVGVVVLRRLDDALADGDDVLAVIRGSAVSNDGAQKVGYLAPGVAGQVAAIEAAHLVADVDPASIGYVETHGTGTEVGDPIEVRALTRAFGAAAAGCCRLGSVKSAIGHTDAAAGVLGLITAVLALRHRVLPGTLHFRRPQAALEPGAGPFVVSATADPWPAGPTPRRAAVNSLGLGGTNAHVVLEEAPPQPVRDAPHAGYEVLPLSARTPQALTEAVRRLGRHLAEPGEPLGDVAWTLQTGRRAFAERAFVVAGDRDDAARALSGDEPGRLATGRAAPGGRSVVFLFPGQGGQYVGMAADLYRDEPVFRTAVDDAAELARADLGLDLREVLYPEPSATGAAQARLDTMRICQPVLFTIQHALTQLWRTRGVVPGAVLGHSLGAYAAATAAGVLDLDAAMTLVLTRGRLLDGLPAGAMLAVTLGPEHLERRLFGDLGLAAVNGPDQCVVTGPADQVHLLHERLAAEQVQVRPLRIAAAAHSVFVDAVLPEYAAVVEGVPRRAPLLPWVSDRTGAVADADEVADPATWVAHLRGTVRFSDALSTVLGAGEDALLEIGPGHALSALARRHPAFDPARPVAQSLPADGSAEGGGAAVLAQAAGRLWASGVDVDWRALHPAGRRRVPLPTYPFQRSRFRLDTPAEPVSPAVRPVAQEPERPLTRTEKVLAAAFADALGMPDVGLHDDFFELGGYSLVAMRIIAAVRPELGEGLSPRAFVGAPTVAGLAALVDAAAGQDRPGSGEALR